MRTPASTFKPVRAIKSAITTHHIDPATGQMQTFINTAGLIKAVSRERYIPRHSSVDSMLSGLPKPALERVLASVSA